MTNLGIDFMRDRYGIDTATAQALLSAALSRGGDYAELYFEHRTTGAIIYEQRAVKSANRSIMQGLGVRVLLGEAVGYAYTEDLIARGHGAHGRDGGEDRRAWRQGRRRSTSCTTTRRTTTRPSASSIEVPVDGKLDLLRRADIAARDYDASIQRVDISIVDEMKHIAIYT